ncbi:hypothetical protein Tco_1342286, partial [Tanacetum coccineum]
AVIEPKTSENVVCKSKLSAESPEFIPQSICSKNKNVKKTDKLRKNNKTPRGNQRGWNGMMNQKLGDNFEFKNKVCYVCGSFDHLQHTCKHKKKMNKQEQVKPIWNKSRHVNHQNFVQKPFHKKTSNYNRCINKNVKGTRYDSSKTKTKVNPVKALAKWDWKPKQAVLEHVSKSSRASKVLTRYDYVDVYGRFKSVLAWDFQKHQSFLVFCFLRVWVLANHHTTNGHQLTMPYTHKNWLVQESTALGKDQSNSLMVARVFVFTKVSPSPSVSSYLVKNGSCCLEMLLPQLILLFIEFMLFPLIVSAACVAAAAYFVPAALQSSCFEKIYLETWN